MLLAAMVMGFTACNSGDNNTTDTTDTQDTTAADIELPAGIEKQDYDGTVNILMPDWSLYTKCFDPGEDMTDVLNKALYDRELKVEEYLGVDITYEHIPEGIGYYYDKIVTAVSTNDDLYQILLAHCIQDNTNMATGGYLVDMNNLDIDFTAEWFNQISNEALEVDGKQFFCINDYMIPDPNVIVFNNDIVKKLSLESPYDLVRNGEWTIDKMIEMSKAVTADNGDSIWNHEDTYGFGTPGGWFLISFIHGADVKFLEKNDAGEFELVFGDDRSYTLMEKLDTLLNGPDTYVFDYRGITEPDSAAAEKALPIGSGRSLFSMLSFNLFWSIRNIDTEFGILPFPKLDEHQEGYYSLDWSGLMCVPFSVRESTYEMVGDTIELLAYYSEEEVIPAYIEDTLGKKFARDDNWAEMLEIVFDGIVFDPFLSYFGFQGDTSNLLYTPSNMLVANKENTFASWMATYGPSSETIIADFNEQIKSIEG